MKFMKLGTRPDTFFTAEAVRSVSSEVSTDLKIQVQNSLYQLHKFPLLSKCLRLQTLYSESRDDAASEPATIHLPNFPGGAAAFEVCAKFCYGITITLSALNIVPVRCAAEYLEMTDDIDRGNLAGKLDVFLTSCILRRWRDTLVTLQSTRQYGPLCEELGLTGRCIDAAAKMVVGNPSKSGWPPAKGWWAEDISELGIDHYWRTMVAIKSAGVVPNRTVGEALQIYACRWLPNVSRDNTKQAQAAAENSTGSTGKEVTTKHRLLLEKIVALLPLEKGAVPCSFLLRLVKAANILAASAATKAELARRVGLQLEEATVSDLLIPSLSYVDETLYDVDIVAAILEEYMLQGRSPPTSPPRDRLVTQRRRRSRSAEGSEFAAQEMSSRRSSSASHGSKLRVAKLIDGYLQEIARDANLPMEKVIALAEAVPDFARPDHDDLYRAIDTYLRAHPELDKGRRKRLCRILDCKKLSVEACMHAAQNELLPLRVVVQVLFFEQARAATSGGQVTELPSHIKAILARTAAAAAADEAEQDMHLPSSKIHDDNWSVSGFNGPTAATLRMKLAEADNDIDGDDVVMSMPRDGLMRSSSSRFKALCSLPHKPRRIFSKLLSMNRSISERH